MNAVSTVRRMIFFSKKNEDIEIRNNLFELGAELACLKQSVLNVFKLLRQY